MLTEEEVKAFVAKVPEEQRKAYNETGRLVALVLDHLHPHQTWELRSNKSRGTLDLVVDGRVVMAAGALGPESIDAIGAVYQYGLEREFRG